MKNSYIEYKKTDIPIQTLIIKTYLFLILDNISVICSLNSGSLF